MKKVQIEDYDIFKTKPKYSLKKAKKVIANIMVYVSIYSSVFLLCDYKLKNPVTDDTRIEIIENEDELLEELEDSTNLSATEKNNQVVFHAVLKNNNLNNKEKELIYNLTDVVDDNKNIDKVSIYNVLKNLDIEYTTRPESYDESVYAIYSYKENKIYIFGNENELNLKIILHELIHTLFTNEKTINLPKYIIEGVTQLLTDEYFSSIPFIEKNTYPFDVTMIKILCEMVGSEKVLEAYTTGNMDIILEELNKSEPEEMNKQFLNDINIVFNHFSDKLEIPEGTYNEMINYMDNYFRYKFSKNPDMLNLYNYYKNGLNLMISENPYDNYSCYIIDNGYYKKAYFCEELGRTTNNTFAYNNVDEEEKILVK